MADPLLNSFRVSHESVLSAVARIQPFARNYLQARPHLPELHERTLAYLGREDRGFYERMRVFFAEDRPALKILEFLEHDWKDLKIHYVAFSQKHTGGLGDSHVRNFGKDFQEFTAALIARTHVEEEYLFPLLERMSRGRGDV